MSAVVGIVGTCINCETHANLVVTLVVILAGALGTIVIERRKQQIARVRS